MLLRRLQKKLLQKKPLKKPLLKRSKLFVETNNLKKSLILQGLFLYITLYQRRFQQKAILRLHLILYSICVSPRKEINNFISLILSMDNYQIADQFSMLSKLLDIHGENSFKSKSYSSTAFAIEKLPMQLEETAPENIAGIKGIGSSSAQKILELLETGQLKALEDLLLITPPGVVEMLLIKGIGPKKINTIWKEMELESVGELLYACKENRLKLYKGFGEKTQQNVIDSIEFYQKSKGSFLYAQVEMLVPLIEKLLKENFPQHKVTLTGEFLRQLEIINEITFLINAPIADIEKQLVSLEGFELSERNDTDLLFKASSGIKLRLIPTDGKNDFA